MSGHEHHEHGQPTPFAERARRVEGHDHVVEEHSAHNHADHAGHADHSGHDHSAHDPAQFRRKFWISLLLTIPTLVFSTGLQEILGLSGPRFPGSQWIPAIFGIAIFLYGGLVFLRGGITELRAKSPGMMTLISLAILVAFAYSLAVTVGLVDGMDFWWELATLITIMLLGHWIEMSAVMSAQNALGELAKLLPDEAEMWHGDHWMTMPVSALSLGDRVIVRPGGAVPVDGTVIEGESEVDESLLTGESTPVAKAPGDGVVAGSINATGALTVEVTKLGEATALAGIMRLVAEAQSSRSGAQLLADRAAKWLFYLALAAAVITAVVWTIILPADPSFVLERVVTVLIIACPHALGLAIPLVAQISTAIGARNGLLIRSRAALEDARRIDVVLFDKTGTLTEGRQGVVEVVPATLVHTSSITIVTRGMDPVVAGEQELASARQELLGLAAAVEQRAEHPIAKAIVTQARTEGIAIPAAASFQAMAGRGATASVDGSTVEVVSQRVLNERGLTGGAELVHAARRATEQGQTTVYVVADERVLGLIALADVIRPESRQAVADLRGRGIRVAMLTGDSHEVAASVAAQLGITEVFAEVLPGSKSQIVARLQKDGSRVAMVGDGINDAPALTQADLGIAIGAGTDVAIESAGIVLASSDPRGVAKIITLSTATYRKMQQNLAWATGYNVIAIPLAAGVLYGVGILLSPAVGAILMSVSTIVVALNAQLLRRVKLSHRR